MSDPDFTYEILPDEIFQSDLNFKIIVIGDSGVGKSCLSLKGIKNIFEDSYSPTVGFEFFQFNIKIQNKTIKLQIWDTCGQEVYRSLVSSFYKNSSLAIIVYAINDENSFKNIESWINEMKSQANPNIKLFLIGNKVDLESNRSITKEIGEKFSKDFGFDYFMETSAKTGFNAKNMFIQVAKTLYEQNLLYKERASKPGAYQMFNDDDQEDQQNNIMLDIDNKTKRKGGCCK